MNYTEIQSPIGRIVLARDDEGLKHIRFLNGTPPEVLEPEWREEKLVEKDEANARWELVFALISGVLLAVGWFASVLTNVSVWLPLSFYVAAYFFGGLYTAREAINSIRVARFGSLGWIYLCGWGVFSILLLYQHLILSEKDLSRVNIAFFKTNGIAGILFSAFVAAELIQAVI